MAFAEAKMPPPMVASDTDSREGEKQNSSPPTTDDQENQTDQPDDVRTIRGIRWFLAYTSLLSTVLFYALDGTIVADIQPAIIEAFGETEKLPWIGAAMFLGATTILPLGRAYGIFNVKWLFLSLVTIFEVGSCLCGAAPNMNAFIIGRVIQGVGACGCYTGAITYLSMTTTSKERPIYLSGVVAIWSLGCVVGPVVGGGFAQSSAGWRWAFYINLIVAAVTAPALIFCLPNIDPAPHLTFVQKLKTQDWLAIAVFLGGSVSFTMALTFGGTVYAYDSGQEIALWVMTGVLLIAFVAISIYHPTVTRDQRLYPIHLMKKLELNILQLAQIVAAGIMQTTLYYTPLLFQFTRGDKPLMAGVRLMPFLASLIFFSLLNGALMPRFGYHMPWYVLGNALMLIGTALGSTIDNSTSTARLYGYTFLIGGGCGAYFTAGFSVLQSSLPLSELSNGISLLATAQTFGQIVLLGVAGSLFTNIGSERISDLFPGMSTEEAIEFTTGIHSPRFEALQSSDQTRVIEQISLAIRNVFIMMVSFAAVSFVGSLFLKRKKDFVDFILCYCSWAASSTLASVRASHFEIDPEKKERGRTDIHSL